MDQLRAERTVARRIFSRACTALEQELKKEEVDYAAAEAKMEAVEYEAEKLFEVDAEVKVQLFAEQMDEEVQVKEFEDMSDYRSKFFLYRKKFESYSRSVKEAKEFEDAKSVVSVDSQFVTKSRRNFKLPKIEQKKFDGELKNWLGFWGQFKVIDESPDINDSDKFQYLLQGTVVGSKARQVVEGFPPSGENYHKALSYLKERFAKDEFLIEAYYRELLTLVIQQASSKTDISLSDLFDRLSTQLRALESLGVTKEKYAAMLYPMVESCLPVDVLKAWGRFRLTPAAAAAVGSQRTPDSMLANLMDFLKAEVENEERIRLATDGFSSAESKAINLKKSEAIPTAATILSVEQGAKPKVVSCVFCGKNSHNSQDCLKALNMPIKNRRDILSNKNACFCCLREGHTADRCRSLVRCPVCSRKHYAIVCAEISRNRKPEEQRKHSTSMNQNNTSKPSSGIVLQTLLVSAKGSQKSKVLRVLLDSGSQRSYVATSIARELKLKNIRKEAITHCLFGGVTSNPEEHSLYEIELASLKGDKSIKIQVLDQAVICNSVPRIHSFDRVQELKAKNIVLTDVGPEVPNITLLLGADVIGKLLTGRIDTLDSSGMVFVETILGWTAMGEYPQRGLASLCSSNLNISDLWDLETLGIPSSDARPDSNDTLENFQRSVTQGKDGRYEVQLPWLTGRPQLSSNLGIAKQRLFSTTKRLLRVRKFNDYENVFREWLEEGVIEVVDDMSEREGVHYLPHHAVIKESSTTTKIRPVFDASAKDERGSSLNSCLDKGPNLLVMIPDLLVRFRLGRFGVVSDIRRAFLQIGLGPRDRDYLRFLWWENQAEDKIMTHRHCRVVFGVASSPFLLGATINHHLQNAPAHLEKTARILVQSFYVDNSITSWDEEQELHRFIKEAQEVMMLGQMDLRGWLYSGGPRDDSECSTSVLGLVWNFERDTLSCNLKSIEELGDSQLTKRKLLSVVQQVFDPIGFTAPVTLLPKILLQEAWKLKLSWDSKLPDELASKFLKWRGELCWVTRQFEVHVFCDASKSAYATAVYLRSESEDDVTVQLMLAKSRVAPIIEITIPRLELLAALIGARMAKTVLDAMQQKVENIYYWTDSTVVLTWLQDPNPWNTFVGNRVREIQKLSQIRQWRHLPGAFNPADLPSRGCGGKTLLESRWWEGPGWLKSAKDKWPTSPFIADEEANQEKRIITMTAVGEKEQFSQTFSYFSRYSRIVRMVAWVVRFWRSRTRIRKQQEVGQERLIVFKNREGILKIKLEKDFDKKAKDMKKIGVIYSLSSEETKEAEKRILKVVQFETVDKNETWKRMEVTRNVDELLRVKTKLIYGKFADNFKNPIILPTNHYVVRRLIEERHSAFGHPGVGTLLAMLREDYWILKGRKAVRGVTERCVTCKKLKCKAAKPTGGALPEDRQTLGSAFEITGTDLAGPLYLKDGGKVWVVLFTCAVYRAVHCELTSSLSTAGFLMCLRRFIARRGRVSIIYSDNGTNFVGANRLLSSVNWDEICSFSDARKIKWKFNPPTAAWWGGWWERVVRTIKELLRRNLGQAALSYEELTTVICDIEAVINARPLTYVAEEAEELQPICPKLFIQDIKSTETPDFDTVDAKQLCYRARYLQSLRELLRQRFKAEYLAELVQRPTKTTKDVAIGDVVLVEVDSLKRVRWPLGVITQLRPGRDGVHRVAEVKTSKTVLTRPVQRLYPLEITAQDASNIRKNAPAENKPGSIEDQVNRTRSGRIVKIPNKFTIE